MSKEAWDEIEKVDLIYHFNLKFARCCGTCKHMKKFSLHGRINKCIKLTLHASGYLVSVDPQMVCDEYKRDNSVIFSNKEQKTETIKDEIQIDEFKSK